MNNVERERRERNFLAECGFDLDNGYFSEDVDFWRRQEGRDVLGGEGAQLLDRT